MTRRALSQWTLGRFKVACSCSGPVESGGTSPVTLECGLMFKVASWNLNSVRSRLTHVTTWLKAREPDVLLLQELKGTEFPSGAFESLGYESVAVTQKAYNGVAILSRHPMKTIAKTLVGDDSDSHARFLEVISKGIRIVNIYLPNGNPVGSDKFAYKLAWMDRLKRQMILWLKDSVPTLVGGDFNVIPEDIDCHKPSSWMHDALFQPEPRSRYRALLELGYTDAFRSLHPNEVGQFTFWDYFRQAFQHNRGIRIDHFLLSPTLADRLEGCEIDKGPRAQEKPSDHTPIIVTLSDLP
jgi:exodeoxyribonuclease-3